MIESWLIPSTDDEPTRWTIPCGTSAAATTVESIAQVLGVELGAQRLVRATTELRSARYADGFEALVVMLLPSASKVDRWRFHRSLELMTTHAWAPGIARVRDVTPDRRAYALDATACALDRIAPDPPALPARVALLTEVGQTLATLHASGVMHGCLAPHNVLIGHDGRPQLDEVAMIDVAALPSSADDALGYRAFAAPELLAGADPTPRTDGYSFGRLVALLLRDLATSEHPAVFDVVRCATAQESACRFATLGEQLDALLHAVHERPSYRIA